MGAAVLSDELGGHLVSSGWAVNLGRGEGAGEARGAESVSLEEELASDCVLLWWEGHEA